METASLIAPSRDIFDEHFFVPNATEAISVAIKAGCNMESNLAAPHAYNTSGYYIWDMAQALEEGFITEDDVDAALYDLLMLRFRLGLFDPIDDQPYWNISPDVVGTYESRNLSLQAAQEVCSLRLCVDFICIRHRVWCC